MKKKQKIQVQRVAPEILMKKTKTANLKVTIPASNEEEEVRKVSKQPSPDIYYNIRQSRSNRT